MPGGDQRGRCNVSSGLSQSSEISSFDPVHNAPHSKFICTAFEPFRSGTLRGEPRLETIRAASAAGAPGTYVKLTSPVASGQLSRRSFLA